ncbi:quinone oxidoreductase [Iodidimonas sp. SYSU 1G8]|uniref:quinone oxidoreductase family protein n=1 Tax=Iodidimonas sp. SYSU 1G8 TaxID=3133967 RepID=UPI0031FEA0C6
MVKAVRIARQGGPEMMEIVDQDLPAPGPGQIVMRNTAIGFNFLDTYHRSGLYPLPMPTGLGGEAAGTVEAVGEGVGHLKPGDRVATIVGALGAYAQAWLVDARSVVPLPDDIPDQVAAAAMLKGLTAEYLLRRTYKVSPGEPILFHAAAGGVGLIACQWAQSLGAVVIGTVGSDAKVQTALDHGCDHVIVTSREAIPSRVREITQGAMVPVVYDSIGKDTWLASLDCLRPRGLMVSFGNSSGAVAGVDLGILAAKGSLYVTRPGLNAYISDPAERDEAVNALFNVIRSDAVRIEINQTYPLDDIVQLHRDAEDRKHTGSTVILP